jgi:hypothetical protein
MTSSRFRLAVTLACGLGLAPALLMAQSEQQAPRAGMSCTVADGWWSLEPAKPSQPEPVKVLELQTLLTGEAGAWVQPLRGPLKDHQFHIAQKRLGDCR